MQCRVRAGTGLLGGGDFLCWRRWSASQCALGSGGGGGGGGPSRGEGLMAAAVGTAV